MASHKKTAGKILLALPLIFGILSILSFAIYFYSANHSAAYEYTDAIFFGPPLSLAGMIVAFLTRKIRAVNTLLWGCGLVASLIGFIANSFTIVLLILFLSALAQL